MNIHFLSQNQFKIATAESVFKPLGIKVVSLNLNIPEIQADTNAEIARHSAMVAAQQVGKPVMREDHGFYLNAFPGWPGPYMAHAERSIPPEDILKLIDYRDRTGYFEMALAYAYPDGKLLEYSFQLSIELTDTVRSGGKDFSWDSIISLKNDTRALSEYPQKDRYPLFAKNFVRLAKELKKSA